MRLRGITAVRIVTAACVALFYGGLVGLAVSATFGRDDARTGPVGGTALARRDVGLTVPSEGDASVPDAATIAGAPTTSNLGVNAVATASPPSTRPTNPAAIKSAAARPIQVGIQFNDPSSDTAYNVLGVKGTTTGDGKGAYQALIADINARGGLGGRKVVPVFYSNNNTQGTFDSQSQAACSAFTEDNRVELAVVTGTASRLLPSCMAAHHVPTLPVGNIILDDTLMSQWAPYVYWEGMLSLDRWAPWIDLLASNGYFDPGARVGLVAYDTAMHHRVVERVITPALARVKHAPVDVAYVGEPQSVSGLGSSATELSNVILRFRSQQIDHVMFVATQGAVPFLWMPEADSQGYRPRYGLTTADFPYVVQANASANQMRGALGMGWTPVRDVNYAQDPGGNPAATRCEALMAKAGNASSDRSADWQSHIAPCEAMFFFEAVMAHGGEAGGAAFRSGVDQLGTSYESPHTFATRFVSGHFDGASKVRLLRYDQGCACFSYAGPLVDVP
ncbi:MAG TPA: hypothetical protein VHC63_02325 [Acidimicrobiales bacterium]|nr:hypothetical protein [Acidimicrobiales bacterium]